MSPKDRELITAAGLTGAVHPELAKQAARTDEKNTPTLTSHTRHWAHRQAIAGALRDCVHTC